MTVITLVGKTNRGKNKIIEAGTNQFLLLETRETVYFSERAGPWLHVTPNNEKDKRQFSRWVHEFDDKDFTVL